MADPILTISDLRVGVADGGADVLRGVSIEIAPGDLVALVGESGSGKSVTSLATMGLLPKGALERRGGHISVGGESVTDATPAALRRMRAKRMSMIFQEPMTALNPVIRVGDQIAEVLEEHDRKPREGVAARVDEILRDVGLPDVARIRGSYPHQLSGGQRQRIMIAMALVLEPALLIADEPTTALDVTTQKQILSLIKRLQTERGTAVLFVTHDMGVVSEIADHIYVMRDGQVVEAGETEAVLRAPREAYTRMLLEAVPSLAARPARPKERRTPSLTVNDLDKVYGGGGFLSSSQGTRAAQDVSFAIPPGRTLGIVGESGSGKSTVARCVMRLIDPTSGQIRVGDTDISRFGRRALRPHRKHIQMVFQDPYRSLNPRLTVGESLVEGAVNFGMARKEALRKAETLMEEVGLSRDVVKRFPHQFSGGQRQRIAIARAVMTEPDILVADEAVSALDVSIQAQVLDLLDDLQRRTGFAMLFITHDLRVAAQVCDDVLVMQNGRVVEVGAAAQVLNDPRHDYTRALIDAAPGRDWDFANFRPAAPVPA